MSYDHFGALPRQRHSPTSVQAAVQAHPAAKTGRYRVWQYICNNPGSTDEEIHTGLGMNPSTQRPRRVELMRYGLVHEIGLSKNKSGSAASRWECTNLQYPEKWPTARKSKKHAGSPTIAEYCEATKQLRTIYSYLRAVGQTDLFGPELEKVGGWIATHEEK